MKRGKDIVTGKSTGNSYATSATSVTIRVSTISQRQYGRVNPYDNGNPTRDLVYGVLEACGLWTLSYNVKITISHVVLIESKITFPPATLTKQYSRKSQ